IPMRIASIGASASRRSAGASSTAKTIASFTASSAPIGVKETTMPKVLISDELSGAAIDIFKSRGIEVDFQPALGGDAAKLKEIIANYDGLAIRSATKVKGD